ncbi:hypothetical protein GGP41_004696 [Bipolaris sorokiniana]|uniref:Uncharacterized protein n=1 Tax=Cochliobolus sativus TaxID=45130 RepID=A0A8H6DSS0_COCSA|nr:hypothetical protein GGP41_004696 [Bipolaris sorokiniana]
MFAPIFVIAPRRTWLPNLNANLDILLASIKPLEAARVVTRTADPRQIFCARGLLCQHTELASPGTAAATQDVVRPLKRYRRSMITKATMHGSVMQDQVMSSSFNHTSPPASWPTNFTWTIVGKSSIFIPSTPW